jgi:hypothetical protein
MAAKTMPATAIQEEAEHKKVETGKRNTRKLIKVNVNYVGWLRRPCPQRPSRKKQTIERRTTQESRKGKKEHMQADESTKNDRARGNSNSVEWK